MRETLTPQSSSVSAFSQDDFRRDGSADTGWLSGIATGWLSGITSAERSGIQPRKRCWIARKYAPWVSLFRANSLRKNSCFNASNDSAPVLVNDILSIACYMPSVACENDEDATPKSGLLFRDPVLFAR